MHLPRALPNILLPYLQHVLDAGSPGYRGELWKAKNPSLNITLSPLFDSSSTGITALSIIMSVEAPAVKAQGVLVTLPLMIGNVPSNRYDGDALRAEDESGHLPLHYVDHHSTNERIWIAQRGTRGDVSMSFVAYPRNITRDTPAGPRVDLRTESGGLSGKGQTFILDLANPDRVYDQRINWNLRDAPAGTRGISTWGDESITHREGPSSDLVNAYYAVGPVKSYTSADMPGYGMYWFDEPSLFNVTQLASYTGTLFQNMMSFFDDFGNSFRVFIRHSYTYGGTGAPWSFMFEYADDSKFEPLDLNLLMSHEMVHNWLIMDVKPGDPEESESWYTEGIAHHYMALLPFRFGLLSATDFVACVNRYMAAYYASIGRNRTLDEISRDPWADMSALKMHYDRGAVFLMRTAGVVHTATKGRTTIDDIVRSHLRVRRRGAFAGRAEWLDLVSAEVGQETAENEFDAMASGALIVPMDGIYGPCFTLIRKDRYTIDFGFPIAYNIPGGVVRELNPSSRAAIAGIQNGDRIIKPLSYWEISDHYNRNSTIRIERNGKGLDITFWPHAWDKVEAYEWALKRDLLQCTGKYVKCLSPICS